MTDKNETPAPPSRMRSLLILFVVFLLLTLVFKGFGGSKIEDHSRFLSDLRGGVILSAEVDLANGHIKYETVSEKLIEAQVILTEKLLEELGEKVDSVRQKPPGFLESLNPLVLMFFSVGLTVFLVFLIIRRMGAGGGDPTSFGQSRAKEITEERPATRFDDVAGLKESKEELAEIVSFLKDPTPFSKVGARPAKGVLLIGPPGCGKTLLARAVAGEAEVPFYFTSGSEFVELFVGVGASRVRSLFKKAKEEGSALIFLDEIDAVGRQRGAGLGGGHDEREQTLNQILVEMDGFEPHDGLIVIAATNRPDILDPALLRSGRFDRKVLVDIPDKEARLAILKIHARDKPLSDAVNLDSVAKRTPGFSGADLENVMNEAAVLVARRRGSIIEPPDLSEAVERVSMGPERKSLVIKDEERSILAWHEAGHALVSHVMPNGTVHKVTIIPRARALGYVLNLPEKDQYIQTRQDLLDQMAVALAGRAAEKIKFSHLSSGAKDDIRRVSEIARTMVKSLGMSEKVGPVDFEGKDEPFLGKELTHSRGTSEASAEMIDTEVHDLICAAEKRATDILTSLCEPLERLATILLEKESLDLDEFRDLMEGLGVPAGTPKNDKDDGEKKSTSSKS
ncbi:ATP-dependent zinc metalloprotease FtsH [bacterium]|nr:ATP-dependent zinc metalloprotease FtsH [bacterium]